MQTKSSHAPDKPKRERSAYQSQHEEDEKVPDTEAKAENILHGPNASMFIKNQKISWASLRPRVLL